MTIKIIEEDDFVKRIKKYLSNNTLVIFVLPIISYAIIYLFNTGLLSYYGISIKEFKISIQDYVIELVGLTVILIYLITFTRIGINYFLNNGLTIYRIKATFLRITINVLLISGCYLNNKPLWLFITFFILVNFILFFWIRYVQKHNENDRLAKIMNKSLEGIGNDFVNLLALAVFVICFPFITMGFGKLYANFQSEYPIANGNYPCIVVFTDSERFACMPYDKSNNEFGPEYKILFYSDNQDYTFQQIKGNPLHPKPTATPTLTPTLIPTPTISLTETETPIPTAIVN